MSCEKGSSGSRSGKFASCRFHACSLSVENAKGHDHVRHIGRRRRTSTVTTSPST